MQLDPYRSRRMDRNDPKSGYTQWLAKREKASSEETSLVHQLAYGQSLDSIYREANQNDSFYFGLSDQIQARQQSKIPIAGEGSVVFFSIANSATKPLAKIMPVPFLPINAMFSFTEMVARERAGL